MPSTVDTRLLLEGFKQAHERFTVARVQHDADVTFRSLFETLNWVVSLDDRLAVAFSQTRRPNRAWAARREGAETLTAVRYARNVVHHQWAEALALDTRGRSYPKTYPVTYFEWRWRDDLGQDSRRGAEHYRRLLSGQPVRVCLAVLHNLFVSAQAESDC